MSHRETIEQLYAAFARGDIPSVLGALNPQTRWTEAEGFPYGGTYVGPQAVLDNVFMRLGGEWDSFSAQMAELVADGDTVVALGTYSGTFKATGKSFQAPFVHVWKFTDGQISEFIQHTDTAVVQRALS
ncbi:MAG: nuclear transport factor 2 family protein [Xanthomonadales bacterium]|nr:nuclear transport factor 2 family protein [Xanthomonadales bacterium]